LAGLLVAAPLAFQLGAPVVVGHMGRLLGPPVALHEVHAVRA
jgi:hypothetical protein